MTHTAHITKVERDTLRPTPPKTTHHSIHAADKDELFAQFFKDYANRYKYCSGTHCTLDDPVLAAEYRVWISNIANYAKAGGDMW